MAGLRKLIVGWLPARELVVGVEPVVLDGDIHLPGLRGQGGRHGRRQLAGVAASPQGKAHGIGVGHAVADGFLDGRLHLLGPIAVKQLRQFAGDRAHGVAARCRLGQQFPAGRRGVGEAVGRPVLAGLALVPGQRLDMGGSLDLLALAVVVK